MSAPPTHEQDWGPMGMVVTIYYPSGQTTVSYALDIPATITIKATNDNEIYDSLREFNALYVTKPQRFTWDIAVPVTSYAYRLIRGLHLNNIPFDMDIMANERDPASGTDFSKQQFKAGKEKLMNCRSSDMSTPYRAGELPIAAFSGKALSIKLFDSANGTGTVEFGNGSYPQTSTILAPTIGKDGTNKLFWS